MYNYMTILMLQKKKTNQHFLIVSRIKCLKKNHGIIINILYKFGFLIIMEFNILKPNMRYVSNNFI